MSRRRVTFSVFYCLLRVCVDILATAATSTLRVRKQRGLGVLAPSGVARCEGKRVRERVHWMGLEIVRQECAQYLNMLIEHLVWRGHTRVVVGIPSYAL